MVIFLWCLLCLPLLRHWGRNPPLHQRQLIRMSSSPSRTSRICLCMISVCLYSLYTSHKTPNARFSACGRGSLFVSMNGSVISCRLADVPVEFLFRCANFPKLHCLCPKQRKHAAGVACRMLLKLRSHWHRCDPPWSKNKKGCWGAQWLPTLHRPPQTNETLRLTIVSHLHALHD